MEKVAEESKVILFEQKSISKENRIKIGEWIKNSRKDRGWSQNKLSEIANLTQGVISLMENKGECLTDENLEKVAAAFETSVEKFTDFDEENSNKKNIFNAVAQHAVQCFLQENKEIIFKRIEEEMVKEIRRVYF